MGLKFCISCGATVASEKTFPEETTADISNTLTVSETSLSEVEPIESTTDEPRPKSEEIERHLPVVEQSESPTSKRNFRITWVLATFFGFLGADRFYLGHVGAGVLKLIGFGWYGVWWLVDLVRINKGTQRDSSSELLNDPDNFVHKARAISAVLIPIVLILNAFILVGVIAALLSPTAA